MIAVPDRRRPDFAGACFTAGRRCPPAVDRWRRRGFQPCLGGGANAVRVGDVLLEIDTDDLGWTITAYVIAGAQATAVMVLAGENANPVRAITGLLRHVAGPMAWERVTPGLYRCGRYLVGQLDTGEWFAEGPGVDRCFDHKRDAQATSRQTPRHQLQPSDRGRAAITASMSVGLDSFASGRLERQIVIGEHDSRIPWPLATSGAG